MATAHSPDRFVVLPFRKGEKDLPDWSQCGKYINTHHSGNYTIAVDDALKSMMNFHNTIIKTCTLADSKNAPNMSFIDHTLKRYCSLITMAQAHLPLNGNKIGTGMRYVWHDSFTATKYDSNNSNSELVSCVYNLAASYAYVAATQAHNATVEDVKQAFQNFQNAAGCYNLVQDLLPRLPPDQLTKGDMRMDSLQMLSKLCMAMAHHCGYLKAETAMKDKHEMLSKIACQAANSYEEVHALVKASPWYTGTSLMATLVGKTFTGKDAEQQLEATRLIFMARACIHLGMHNEAETEIGNTIAYYIKAKEYLAKLPKMPTTALTLWVNSIVKALDKAHADAERANGSVYYARVPKEVPEPASLPAPLGKPADFSALLTVSSKRGEDPFFGIVPAHVAKEASQWHDKQRKAVQACQSAAANSRNGVKERLQALGVASIIQTMSSEVQDKGRVPEPLRSKLLQMRNGNEGKNNNTTERLMQYVNTCKQLTEVFSDRVTAVHEELKREKAQDAKYLASYGEKMWRSVCPPSEQTPDYSGIQAALTEHERAWAQYFRKPFAEAQQTLDVNLRDMARLDLPMADLDALMPFVKTKEARAQSGQVMGLVEQLRTIMTRRDALEEKQLAEERALTQLLESDEVTFGLSAVEAGERDAVLAKGSQRITESIERVNACSRESAGLVTEAETAVTKLGELQSADPITAEIQKVTNSLENGLTMYVELCKDFDSITQYGSSTIDKVGNVLATAQSFTLSRQLQAEELQQSLDAQIAAKMAQMSNVQSEIDQSRQRQAQLQNELNQLQHQQGGRASGSLPPSDIPPPSYDSAMNSTYNPPSTTHYQQQQQHYSPNYAQPPPPVSQGGYGQYPPPQQQQQQYYAPSPQQGHPPQYQQLQPPQYQQYQQPPPQHPQQPPPLHNTQSGGNAMGPSYRPPAL